MEVGKRERVLVLHLHGFVSWMSHCPKRYEVQKTESEFHVVSSVNFHCRVRAESDLFFF